MKQLHEELRTKKISIQDAADKVQMMMNLSTTAMQSSKYAMDQNLQIMAVGTYAQRDAYIANMDYSLPKEAKLKLRNAPFNGPTLFHGEIDPAIQALKDVKTAKPTVTVKLDMPPGQQNRFRPYNDNKKEDKPYNRRNNYGNNNYSNNNNNRGRSFYGNNNNNRRYEDRGRGGKSQYNSRFSQNKSWDNKSWDNKSSWDNNRRGSYRGRGRRQ